MLTLPDLEPGRPSCRPPAAKRASRRTGGRHRATEWDRAPGFISGGHPRSAGRGSNEPGLQDRRVSVRPRRLRGSNCPDDIRSGSGPRSRSRLEPAGLDRKPDCDRRCATLWPRAQLVYEGRRGYAVASGRCPLDAHHTLCTSRRRPDRPSRSIQRPCLLVSGQGARCHLVFSRADHPSDPSGARGLRQCAVTQRISVRPIVLPKPTGRLQGPQGHLPRHGAAKGLDRQSAALPSEAVAFKVVTPRR